MNCCQPFPKTRKGPVAGHGCTRVIAIESRAHHGKTTIDEKSDQVSLAISIFISNAACGCHPPNLKYLLTPLANVSAVTVTN
jgi:hypothetical protein